MKAPARFGEVGFVDLEANEFFHPAFLGCDGGISNAEERIAALLLELLEAHGSISGGRWELRIRLSHEEFAGLIGATRETVTVTLGQMQREGLIEIQRKRIIVLDRPRLQAELKDKMGMIPSKEAGNAR